MDDPFQPKYFFQSSHGFLAFFSKCIFFSEFSWHKLCFLNFSFQQALLLHRIPFQSLKALKSYPNLIDWSYFISLYHYKISVQTQQSTIKTIKLFLLLSYYIQQIRLCFRSQIFPSTIFLMKNRQHRLIENIKRNYDQNSHNTKKNSRRHSSSREASGTEVMQQEYSSKIQQKVCPQLILITAMDTVYWNAVVQNIKKLTSNYNRDQALKMIQKNAKFYGLKNINNLLRIDNDQFWKTTFLEILKIVLEQSNKIKGKVETLYEGVGKVVVLTKLQILVILGQMFLCIFPSQMHTKHTNFGWLMQVQQFEMSDKRNRAEIRFEKLKCIINYFNMVVKRKDLHNEVQFQRTSNEPESSETNTPLRSVDFIADMIQSTYGQCIMTDFANKQIGGGVLTNGSVQQQIMFATFPELIISKLLCEKMNDNQAIIIYGAERFSNYVGYAQSFKFDGQFYHHQQKIYKKSIIVAIDALDYKTFSDSNIQYNKANMKRQINKAFTGFEGVNYRANENLSICTGKWGCGAFGGDQMVKFFIQWIACSQANRSMTYCQNNEDKRKQLKHLVQQLIEKTTSDLYGILEEYSQFKKQFKGVDLITYVKDFVI